MKTVEYLEAVKTALDVMSDYELAKRLGVRKQRISHYRNGVTFSDDMAQAVAGILGIEAMVVIVDMHIERAINPKVREAWELIAKKIA